MAENPYEAPKAEINLGAPAEIAPPDVKMPGTVIATIVIVSLMAVLSLIGLIRAPTSVTSAAGLAIYALILVGLIRGHALAWQWGIVIPTLFAVFVLLGMFMIFSRASRIGLGFGELLVILVPLALYVSIPVLLSFKSSRRFFGLQCPKCGEVRGRAASFLFTKRRCGACKFEWIPAKR
jgi:hypothetical protein